MKPTLKPYQMEGRDFLASRSKALLADQMRLGKTVQAIAAAVKVDAKRILVLCPAIAVDVWKQHFEDWDPRGISIIDFRKFNTEPVDLECVLILGYDMLSRYTDLLLLFDWDLLICDESHYLKSPEAKRTWAVYGTQGLVRQAKRVWCLTGTPMPNNPAELWTMLYTFGTTRLSYADFINQYCIVNCWGKIQGAREEGREELRAIMDRVMMRRLTKQVLGQLPSAIVQEVFVEPDASLLDLVWPVDFPDELIQAREAEKTLRMLLTDTPREYQSQVLTQNTKTFQSWRRLSAMLKAPECIRLVTVEVLTETVDKVVVFGYHREPLMVMKRLLKDGGVKVGLILGSTGRQRRAAQLRRFQTPGGGLQVLLCQIQTAGTAIDLSVAREAIVLEEDWVPGNNAQAMERLGGIRQLHQVRIRKLILADSIDEIVSRVVMRKSRDISALFD